MISGIFGITFGLGMGRSLSLTSQVPSRSVRYLTFAKELTSSNDYKETRDGRPPTHSRPASKAQNLRFFFGTQPYRWFLPIPADQYREQTRTPH
jgi:hypothetical protein